MTDTHRHDEPLSPEGQLRREEILRTAEVALDARRRRRRLRRGVIAAALLALGVFLLRPALPRATETPSPELVAKDPPTQEATPLAPPFFEQLDLPYRLELLDDEGLNRELAALGLGLIRIDSGPAKLVTSEGEPYQTPLPGSKPS